MRDMKCPNCRVNDYVVKLGTTFSGRRRFGCKKCKKSFYKPEIDPVIRFKDGSLAEQNSTNEFELGKKEELNDNKNIN